MGMKLEDWLRAEAEYLIQRNLEMDRLGHLPPLWRDSIELRAYRIYRARTGSP